MAEAGEGPPLIVLPERLDRRMRLGPFPSSRDALKFVAYAAVGALLAPFLSPWLWLPIVLGGFAVSVWRPEGRAVDETALLFVAWKVRSARLGGSLTRSGSPPIARQGLLRVGSHRHVAILRTGGTPIAYLPPEELARRFDLYRDLLRSTDGSLAVFATTVPIRAPTVRPPSVGPIARDAPARAGYSELVDLLCRRRLLRRVYLVLGTLEGDTDSIGRLEGRVANLAERLSAIGVRSTRLKDRALAEAARRFGWPAEVASP
jgi:hypothetical protein